MYLMLQHQMGFIAAAAPDDTTTTLFTLASEQALSTLTVPITVGSINSTCKIVM